MYKLNYLTDEFIKKIILHEQYNKESNVKEAKKTYREIIQIINNIHRLDPLFKSILILFKHPNKSVRMYAAFVLLFVKNKPAEKLLKEISTGTDMTSFTAENILNEWYAGKLKPLYEHIVDL